MWKSREVTIAMRHVWIDGGVKTNPDLLLRRYIYGNICQNSGMRSVALNRNRTQIPPDNQLTAAGLHRLSCFLYFEWSRSATKKSIFLIRSPVHKKRSSFDTSRPRPSRNCFRQGNCEELLAIFAWSSLTLRGKLRSVRKWQIEHGS